MIRVQIDKTYVPVFPGHFQLVGWRPVDVLCPKIFDRVSFRLPINQWPVHLRVFHERFGIIGRHSFGISASKEWRDPPSFLAVIRLDLSHSLERRFSAHVLRPPLNL